MTAKATLLTNIDEVSIGKVHTRSNALLVERRRLRGYLYNSVTPAFEVALASPEYTSERLSIGGIPSLSYTYVFQGLDRKPLEVRLNTHYGTDEQVRVDEFGMVGSRDDDGLGAWSLDVSLDYRAIFDTLNRRIVAYWNGPYFLESHQVSIHDARRNVGIERP